MNIEDVSGISLRELAKTNVILGKNGCGKSHLLKALRSAARERPEFGAVRYVNPERGGLLVYEAGMEQSISAQPNWLDEQRAHNQSDSFRQQSAALCRRLELRTLRGIERDQFNEDYVRRTFDTTFDRLNILLDRVRLVRDDNKAFKIVQRDTEEEVQPRGLSSGEAELISLGIEFLAYLNEIDSTKDNLFLVDEPDVHLHPDLQDRLAKFIVEAFRDARITLILATHSTALLAALGGRVETRVAFMRRNDRLLTFKAVSDVDKAILPIFGAHPLSNVFNQAPALLIEGEDDERVWQQAVRSANGRVRVFPCVVEGIARFSEFETEVNNVIEAVYDEAKGYSLRDRDLHPEIIDDVGHVVRMRLSCRSAENLMLSDEALNLAGTDWNALREAISAWVRSSPQHQFHRDVQTFMDDGFDRKGHDLKAIRNILIGLMSNKPWEVLVGQAIASLTTRDTGAGAGTLRDFLGAKVCTHILRL